MKIQPTQTVRDLVSKYPGVAPVLEHFGIHSSQYDGQSIGEACARANIHFPDFARQMHDGNFHSGEEVTRWKTAPLDELAKHIVDCHHAFVKSEGPKIELQLQTAVSRYGRLPELEQILEIFRALSYDMGQHGDREDTVLFPYIHELAKSANAGNRMNDFGLKNVDSLICAQMQEHAAASGLREKITELTHHYTAPKGAGQEIVDLYKALFDFECDLRRHLYLEDNFLYPRALELFFQRQISSD